MILRLARPHEQAVEIGTAARGRPSRSPSTTRGGRVTTYDPIPRAEVEDYLRLAPEARDRIDFVKSMATFEAWRDRIAPGGAVVFHDFHSTWPGVEGAIDELALRGSVTASMFVWRAD